MTRLETAQAAYVKAFREPPPEPFGMNDERIAEVLEAAVAGGAPVPDSFDWWAHQPPNAAG
jgi:hypothetical protein